MYNIDFFANKVKKGFGNNSNYFPKQDSIMISQNASANQIQSSYERNPYRNIQ